MGLLKYMAMGIIAGGQTLVIDVNGNVRVLLEGEQPKPGEVVINPDGTQSTVTSTVQFDLIDPVGVPQNITTEVEDIFAALEEGADPTQLGDDFATAAGGLEGSSPTGSGTIERDGASTLASTSFETDGFTSLGLSETQALTLIDLEQQLPPFFTEAENGPPLGDNLSVETDEDTPVSGQLTASDPNDDPLTYELSSGVTNGVLDFSDDGSWTYTPNDDFNGQDSFIAIVDDGNGGTDTLTVDIDVNPINDPPVVDSNTITVDEESIDTSLGLSAPTDIDGDDLTITVTGLPDLGTVTLADGTPVSVNDVLTAAQLEGLEYDAPAEYDEGDPVGSFTYNVDDGQGESNSVQPGSVTINVNPINDPPVVDSNTITVNEESVDTSLGLNAPTDIDGDVLTITVTGLPDLGTVTLDDGTPVSVNQVLSAADLEGLQYDAPLDYNGSDEVGSFTYNVDDGQGESNSVQPGSVDINVIRDIELSDAETVGDLTDEDTVSINFVAGDEDIVEFEFGSTDGISVSGLDGSLTWSVDNDGKLIGSVNNTALISIVLIGGTITAGMIGAVTVEATLLDNMQHEINTDSIEIEGIIVNAVDVNDDSTSVMVNVNVADDGITVNSGDLTTYNTSGLYVGDSLLDTTGADTLYTADLSSNINGWDPDNGVTFVDSGKSSGGLALFYFVDPDNPVVLYAYTDTAENPSEYDALGTQELIFTLTAEPNNDSYVLDLKQPIDSISNVTIADLTNGEGGINNIVYVGFNPDLDPNFDLDYDQGQLEDGYEVSFTLTALSSNGIEGNVNGSNNGFGVDNPSVDQDETLIVDFVDNVASASFSFTGAQYAYYVAYDDNDVEVSSGDFQSGEELIFDGPVSYVQLMTSETDGHDNFQFIGASAEVIESIPSDVSLDFSVTVNDSDGDTTNANFTIDLNAPADMTLTGSDNDGRLLGSSGDDTFIGNDGADIFTVLDSFLDGSADIIKDFDLAEGDKIDISDLFSNLSDQQEEDILAAIDASATNNLDDSAVIIEIEDTNSNTMTIEIEGLVAADITQELQQMFIVRDE